MDTFDAMETCRAMRYLKPDPVPDELVEKVIHAATCAPSPGNSQGRDFVVVTDPAKRAAIGELFAGMSEGIAHLPRPDRSHRLMYDGVGHLTDTIGQCPVLIFVCGKAIYPEADPTEDYVWSSLYPAAQNLILAARALGLGTVFTTFQSVAEGGIREILGIPFDVYIAAMIPMGWPDKKFGPLNRVPLDQVIHHDGWQGDLR